MIPFVKTFKTSGHSYILDVNSNAIFRTDAATASLVHLLGQGIAPRPASLQLRGRYSQLVLAQSLRKVRYWKQKGYLSGSKPSGLRFPLSQPEFREQLSSGIRQLILGVTESCNLRCRYCVYGGTYSNFRRHQSRNMTFAVARKALDFFYEHSLGEKQNLISFYGGEPLYNFPLMKQCVDYYQIKASARTVRYNITTNATLMNAEVRAFLAGHDVIVRVSLDGPQQVHDTNRVYQNARGTYEAVRRNLEALKREFPEYFRRRVSVCAVMGKPYKLSPVCEFFDQDDLFEGISISVNGVRPVETTYLKEFPAEFDDAEVAVLRERYIRQTVDGVPVSPFIKALFEPRLIDLATRKTEHCLEQFEYPNQVCVPGARRLFVDTKGRFQPCERFNDSIFIGDVDSGFAYDKVFGLVDDYIEISEKDCRDCWAIRLCRSCFISANGKGMDPDYKRQHCQLERGSVENSLVLYCDLMERNPNCLDHLKDIVFS